MAKPVNGELPAGTVPVFTVDSPEDQDEIIIYETLPPMPKSKKEKWTKGTTIGVAIRDVVKYRGTGA